MRTPADRTLVVTELALVAVTLSVVVTVGRLFDSVAALWRVGIVAVLAHLTNAGLRRRNVHPLASSIAVALCGALVLSWLFLRDTTFAGFPTVDTVHVAVDELSQAFAPFRRLVAPVTLNAGFELALAGTVWVLVAFADAAAFRGDAPAQAVVPFGAIFLFSAILANGRGAVPAALCVTAGVGLWTLAWRTRRSRRHRWVGAAPMAGPGALLRSGAALLTLSLGLGALVLATIVPVKSSGMVDLRRIGAPTPGRVAANPLVEVASYLRERSDQELFEVRAQRPHYMRLTSLEQFDEQAQTWFSSQRFDDVSGVALPPALGAGRASRPQDLQQVRILGLRGIWLPAAYSPTHVWSDVPLRFAPESASLILRNDDSDVAGMGYTVRSVTSDPPDRLRSSGTTNGTQRVDADLVRVPSGLRRLLDKAINEVLADAGVRRSDTVAALRALQDYFRTFDYDGTADFRGAKDPTATFLESRRGFCQQFASTFALMARAIGAPARVAVGFTPGTPTPGSGGMTNWVVRGAQAHAWPEVLLDDVGWVAFEPTPSRGNPDSVRWTGVAAPTATEAPSGGVTTTVAGSQSAAGTRPTPPTSTPAPEGNPSATSAEDHKALWWLMAVIAATIVGGIVASRRRASATRDRRLRRLASDPDGRVELAWAETRRCLGRLSLHREVTETIVEFATRAGVVIDDPDLADLTHLADIETARLFSTEPVEEDAAATAEEIAGRTRVAVAQRVEAAPLSLRRRGGNAPWHVHRRG